MNRLQLITAAVLVLAVSGCATSGDRAVRAGSKTWHEERLLEIGVALDSGEFSMEEYLRLKNETDEIRANQIAAARERSRVHTSIRFGYYGGHGFGHGHHHRGRLHRW